MDLVALLRGARRVVHAGAAPASALAAASHIAHGGFARGKPQVLDLLVALACGLAGALRARHGRPAPDGEVARPLDVHVSLAAASLGGALVAWTGGTAGPLSALPVLVVAIGVALGHARRTWLLVVFGVGLEVALHRASHGAADPLAMGLRAALIVAAAGLHHGLTRVEVARVRAHAKQLLADERKRQKEDARSLRLAAPAPAAAPPPAQRNERVDEARVRSSLEEIHASLVGLLELARRTMRLHTCALYWTDAKGRSLRIVEAATAGDLQVEPLAATSGLLGATLNHGKTLALAGLRDEHPGLTHYATPAPVRCFAGVPVLDDGVARGVLAADRTDDAPFTPDDQATLEAVALQARRLIDNERVFARLERARDDLSRLFNASRALGEALTEDEVLQAVALSARSIVDHDLLVVTAYDPKSGEHKVRHVAGAAPRGLEGLAFADNAGIASAAVKARHALPYKGQFDAKAQYVFTKDVAMGDVSSVLVLPLVVRDAVLGAVTLAAQRRAAFPEGTRQLLGVLAGHASVALANAAAVRRLEELATTDPMTGHLNKRAFEQEFDRRLRAAERFARSLAVVVLDIDKFKGVNDTYGHAVGDQVIKGLGAVLSRCRRETDAVARFGGEEFVLVCEETDTEGAFQVAERIREELARQVFATEKGPLQVTCSLGVSEFPRDASTRDALFQKADAALYEAKHGGRNQTRTAQRREEGASKRKPAVSRREASPRAPVIRPGGATTTAS
ncbi:MAG: diguanylate cyclase [Polyangiales bacterium]